MDEWLIWLIFAVVLGIAETLSLTASLGVLGGAALVTSGVAAVGLPLPVQLLAFTAVATTGVLLIRPIALRHRRTPPPVRFDVAAPDFRGAAGKRAGNTAKHARDVASPTSTTTPADDGSRQEIR